MVIVDAWHTWNGERLIVRNLMSILYSHSLSIKLPLDNQCFLFLFREYDIIEHQGHKRLGTSLELWVRESGKGRKFAWSSERLWKWQHPRLTLVHQDMMQSSLHLHINSNLDIQYKPPPPQSYSRRLMFSLAWCFLRTLLRWPVLFAKPVLLRPLSTQMVPWHG